MKIAISILFLISILICNSNCSYYSKMREQQQNIYNDLQNVCDSLPTNSKLEKIDAGSIIKNSSGVFTNSFRTDLSCSDVYKSYEKDVLSQGWKNFGKDRPSYFKENHVISVSCGSRFNTTEENLVQVSCSWDEKGENKKLHEN